MKTLTRADATGPGQQLCGLLEEILCAEVLTRVWTAVGCGCDAALGLDEATPILMNVWASQREARQRVLSLLVSGAGLRFEQVLAANRVRRMSERWTDLLLSHLAGVCPADRFAHSSRRLAQFAGGLPAGGCLGQEPEGQLLRAALRISLQSSLSAPAANPELNQQIAQSILVCFPADFFDSTGLPKGVQLVSLGRPTQERPGTLDDFLVRDDTSALPRDFRLRARRR